MKKFKYRLEAILKVREHIEKEKQRDLAAATRKVNDQFGELKQIDQNRSGTLSTQSEKMRGRLSVAEMLVYGRYIMKLKRDTLAGREVLKVLRKDESQKRGELLEASQARRVYQKLKERQHDHFLKEASRSESKESDEVASTNHRRRSGPDDE